MYALVQPHFDYACSAWSIFLLRSKFDIKSLSNLNKKFKSKLQTVQNRCIRYCLQLNYRSHFGMKEFEKINWLPVSERFNQYLCSNAFKFFKETCPLYFHDIYRQSSKNQANARSSAFNLEHPLNETQALKAYESRTLTFQKKNFYLLQ